ncbi:MAG: M48 family metalloprotease [Ectothiorhodospira sp.]
MGTAPVRAELPDLGDPASALLSPSQEQALGRRLLREVRRSLPLSQDPLLVNYVQSLGQRLVSHVPDGGHAHFRFLVVEDASVNAFAMPGGVVGINTGLMRTTRNEAELAAVIAHEIAHVTQRHIAQAHTAGGRSDLASGLAILAGIIASAYVPELGQAAIVGGMAGGAQARLNFTRAKEEEADRIGVTILADAEYAPEAMPDFFERMMQLGGPGADAVPEYLRTHPVTQRRIAETRDRAARYDDEERVTDSREFGLMRARAWALTDPEAVLAAHADQDPEDSAAHYAQAVALIQQGRTQDALAALDAAREETDDPPSLYLELARAEAFLAGRDPDPDRALEILERLQELYPHFPPVAQTRARALLAADHPARALQAVDHLLTQDVEIPSLYRLKGEAAKQMGRTARSHEAMAEYYFHHGQYREAVRQLDIALSEPGLDTPLEQRIRSKRETAVRFAEEEREDSRS